jgi:thiosulfate dehydrogenase
MIRSTLAEVGSIVVVSIIGVMSIWISAQSENLSTKPDRVAIEAGKDLVVETHLRLPNNVGNGLNCTSCHLAAGTKPRASAWIGITAKFPQYSERHGRVITLQQRINDCFQRSMNGKALDENSSAMKSILAYMGSLSDAGGMKPAVFGFGDLNEKLIANAGNGKMIFSARCAACHGANGQGVKSGTGYAIPPLWGADSFNDGAGMARTYTAAAFVKQNMPPGSVTALTDQDAIDVAGFFAHQPRPIYSGKSSDWPNGGKPPDARN